MGEIKSAWEIAQDKAEKLGSLSPEEKRKQKEQEYQLAGKALADKHLEKENTTYLLSQIHKYNAPDKQKIIHAVVERLIGLLDIKNGQNTQKIYEGIRAIGNNRAIDIINQINELLNEHERAESEERMQIENAGKKILHGMTITGTAIDSINIQANAEWIQHLERVSFPYQERLDNLKESLLTL